MNQRSFSIITACGLSGLVLAMSAQAREPRLVADIQPGPGPGLLECDPPSPLPPTPTFFLASASGRALLSADDGTTGAELWLSDGSGDGTAMLADLWPGPEGGLSPCLIGVAAMIDGVLYFTADDGVGGLEAWRSDGTAAGTIMLGDINPGPGPVDPFQYFGYMAYGQHVYFTVSDSSSGTTIDKGLWRTDAATGTMTELFFPTPAGSHVLALAEVAGFHFFQVVSIDGSTFAADLWRTDGTAAGTVPLTAVPPFIDNRGLTGAIAFQGFLYYFRRQDSVTLRRSDGLVDEEVALIASTTGSDPVGFPLAPHVVGERLIFFVKTGPDARQIWRSDGTAAGTEALGLPPFTAFDDDVTAVLGRRVLLFAADDGIHGLELWRSDGTDGGTELVADRNPGPQGSFIPWLLEGPDGNVLAAQSPTIGVAPSLSSIDAGSLAVRDLGTLCPGAESCRPTRPALLGDTLIYGARVAGLGWEPWAKDGVGAGALPVPALGTVGLALLVCLLGTVGWATLRRS